MVQPTVRKRSIWILEDEEAARFIYESVFGGRYDIRLFTTVEDLREAMKGARPDLLISDLKLPGESFLSFLDSPDVSLLKGVPFLVISSLDDTDALRQCFASGALDYITKPFGKGELLVKAERILESRGTEGNDGGRLRIDPSTMRAYVGERASSLLTAKEFQILSLLEKAPNQTVTRKEIVERVWGTVRVGSKTLDVHIFNLRRKLNGIEVEIAFGAPNHYRLAYKR